MSVLHWLRWLIVFPLLLLLTLVFALVTIFWALFSWRDGPTRAMTTWARVLLWLTGIRFRIYGLERLTPGVPAIYMSNHASMIDIPLLMAGLPLHLRFMYKKQLDRVPLIGFVMRRTGMISVNRENRQEAARSLHKAGEHIKEGLDLLIFPEGTRSRDGSLLQFKRGGFILALQENIDIQPICIRNSQSVCGRNSLITRPGIVDIEILPRVAVGDRTMDDRKAHSNQVRDMIDTGLRTQTITEETT